MATIKGLTIEIAGNTINLTKARSGVNKQSRDLQAELKQVDRLLKLDPINVNLLAQRQAILAAATENWIQKEKMLKDGEAQAQGQFKQGKASEEQVRAIEREVIKAGLDTEKFGAQTKEAMDKAENSTAMLGDTVRGLASTMGINLPPLVVLPGRAGLAAAQPFSSKARLAAGKGATARGRMPSTWAISTP